MQRKWCQQQRQALNATLTPSCSGRLRALLAVVLGIGCSGDENVTAAEGSGSGGDSTGGADGPTPGDIDENCPGVLDPERVYVAFSPD